MAEAFGDQHISRTHQTQPAWSAPQRSVLSSSLRIEQGVHTHAQAYYGDRLHNRRKWMPIRLFQNELIVFVLVLEASRPLAPWPSRISTRQSSWVLRKHVRLLWVL
jgi:hypothetical protein